MPEITAATVAKLRDMTSAGMMDCKKALIEANGDLNAAVDILRKRGAATATTKAAKEAREGVIVRYIQPDSRAGILAEVNCQTDFVARNEAFRAFCDEVARKLLADPKANFDAERVALVAKTGENIKVSRHHRMTVTGHGMVAAYIHHGEKVGVLVEVGCGNADTVGKDEFKQLVRDITLQIAAANPGTVSRDQVPAEVQAKEREIAAAQVQNKPPQVLESIVKGKLEKFYQTYCLLDQGFVKRNAEISVKEHIGSVARQLGDSIQVRQFVRFQVGEVTS